MKASAWHSLRRRGYNTQQRGSHGYGSGHADPVQQHLTISDQELMLSRRRQAQNQKNTP